MDIFSKKSLFIATILAFILVTPVLAWVEPTFGPLENDAPAPINVADEDQIKPGGLSIGTNAVSLLRAFTGLIVGGVNGNGVVETRNFVNAGLKAQVLGKFAADSYCNADGSGCRTLSELGGGGGGSSLWASSSANIYNTNTGNVGIGTGAVVPAHKLHLLSGLLRDGIIIDAATVPEIAFRRNGSAKGYIGIDGSSPSTFFTGAASDALVLRSEAGPIQMGYGSNLLMTLATDGNVGIGVNPLTLLHLKGVSPTITVEPNGDNQGSELDLKTTFLTDRTWRILAGSGAGDDNTNFRIMDGTAGADRLNIDSDGNVGIGTAAPTYRLDVQDSNSTKVVTRIGDGTTTKYSNIYLQANTGTGQIFKNGSAYNSAGGPGSLNIYNSEDTPITFYQKGVEEMRVNTGGNVGIGTASPSTKLEVSGQITATGFKLPNTSNCTDGQVLKWSGGVGQCGVDNGTSGGTCSCPNPTWSNITSKPAGFMDGVDNGFTNIYLQTSPPVTAKEAEAVADCPTGYRVVGGGGWCGDNTSGDNYFLRKSRPLYDGQESWLANCYSMNGQVTAYAYAMCVK